MEINVLVIIITAGVSQFQYFFCSNNKFYKQFFFLICFNIYGGHALKKKRHLSSFCDLLDILKTTNKYIVSLQFPFNLRSEIYSLNRDDNIDRPSVNVCRWQRPCRAFLCQYWTSHSSNRSPCSFCHVIFSYQDFTSIYCFKRYTCKSNVCFYRFFSVTKLHLYKLRVTNFIFCKWYEIG